MVSTTMVMMRVMWMQWLLWLVLSKPDAPTGLLIPDMFMSSWRLTKMYDTRIQSSLHACGQRQASLF